MAATADADVSPPLEPLTAAVAMPAGSVSGGPAGPTAKGHRFGEDAMQTPQDVEQMRSLHGMGWSQRTIARELGCCPRTVRQYLRQGVSGDISWPSASREAAAFLWTAAVSAMANANASHIVSHSSDPPPREGSGCGA